MSKASTAKSANVQPFYTSGTNFSRDFAAQLPVRRFSFEIVSLTVKGISEGATESKAGCAAAMQSKEAIMQSRMLRYMRRVALLAAMLPPFPLVAQTPTGPTHYVVVDLGTLGGSQAGGSGINNRSWSSGMSTLPGDQVT